MILSHHRVFTKQFVHGNGVAQDGSVQGEIGEIDGLRVRLDGLARQHEVQDAMNAPTLRNPNEPTRGGVGKHELTHANFKAWCPHSQAWLAQ